MVWIPPLCCMIWARNGKTFNRPEGLLVSLIEDSWQQVFSTRPRRGIAAKPSERWRRVNTGRRNFLKNWCAIATGSALTPSLRSSGEGTMIVVDPKPLFEISPYLYMQFMEPLGTTDGSVEAAWDYEADDWRDDLIDVVRDLDPGVVRFGGLFSRYYRWREGVGPVEKRPSMRNYVWGGMETNRVGTG